MADGDGREGALCEECCSASLQDDGRKRLQQEAEPKAGELDVKLPEGMPSYDGDLVWGERRGKQASWRWAIIAYWGELGLQLPCCGSCTL